MKRLIIQMKIIIIIQFFDFRILLKPSEITNSNYSRFKAKENKGDPNFYIF